MWRISFRVACIVRMRYGIVGTLVALMLACGWAQSNDGVPKVVFLEPNEGASIPTGLDSIQIRFRLISPDNTDLMRYQPFINGAAGTEQPIPIDPPSPQTELTILWHGLRQFPDGIYIVTIKVVDAKGREGMGSLTLYKGRDSTKPTAEILQPKSGDSLRGQVPILVRVSDDRGVTGITVNAIQKETSNKHTIYMAGGNYGRFMEVRVIWDTTEKHPETKEDLFPDGIYLLQAKVRDQEGNEGVSNEVLVIVQNKVAQPVISQVPSGQTIRGGAVAPILPIETSLAPEIKLPMTTFQLLVPIGESKPTTTEDTRTFSPTYQIPTQVAMATLTPHPRLTVTFPTGEIAGRRATDEPNLHKPDLPLPQVVGAVLKTARPNLSVVQSESKIASSFLSPQPQPTNPLTSSTPQIAPIGRMPMNAPNEQIRLAAAWLPPSPRTLQRAPEVSETPKIVSPMSTPRLPAPETTNQRETLRRIPRHTFSLQPTHSFRYTVIAGDTLYGLAEKFGISVQELAAVNGLPENAPLRIGQRLIIPARPVSVLVDGKPAQSEVPAFVRNGVTIGSLRAIVEASGGIVGWDNERKQATANLGSLSLIATIGENVLKVNDEPVHLSIAPFLLRNRTFLPLRELGVALGKKVQWEKGILLMEKK